MIEKQLLVADILNIPKEDFEHVADMASEPSSIEKEPAELILAAISQGISINRSYLFYYFIIIIKFLNV